MANLMAFVEMVGQGPVTDLAKGFLTGWPKGCYIEVTRVGE